MFLLSIRCFSSRICHFYVVLRTSRRYFPLPEILSFQFLTSIIFVECIFSSSQIAVKGLQNSECIERVLVLLKINKSGGEFFLNINPKIFFKRVLQIFTFTFLLFPLTKYVISFRTIYSPCHLTHF